MNTKEKKLAIALAGGLIASNLGVVTASANTNVVNNQFVLEHNQEVAYPTITQQTINFDKDNPKDLVITGINYFSQTLLNFTVADDEKMYKLDANKLKYDDSQKTLTIPSEVIKELNLSNGMHACRAEFSDGTLYVGAITINVTNSNTSTTPPTAPELPPSNGGTEVNPPEDVNGNPTVEKQILVYDKSKSEDLVVEGVNYDGTELKYIYIGSNFVDAKELILNNDTITIPTKVLSTLPLVTGNYDVSFKFSNGISVIGNVNLSVKDSSIVAPPTTPEVPPSNGGTEVKPPSNDKDFEVVVDINNLKTIEIPNFIPKDSKVDYVIINGKKLPVIYKNLRSVDDISSAPAVYVVDDKLVLSPEVFEYIGFESSTYDIQAVLEDGSVVSKTLALNITNPSEKPEDQQKPVVPSEDKENVKNPSSDNKNESSIGTSNNASTLPKTGYAVTSSLIGTIVTGIGAVLLRRKK